MEKKILPYLVLISALSVSLSAAFYSVTGLSKMFSGASSEVMIMMTTLEIAKLVLASLLYQYWDKLNRMLKIYYFIAIFVLMSITSGGIYGYLSSAYSETSSKVENIDRQIALLDSKVIIFNNQLSDIRNEKSNINNNINDLTKGLSNNIIQNRGKDGQIVTTTSSANRRSFEAQLNIKQIRLGEIQIKESALNDSISSVSIKKLEIQSNSDIAGEIGPLKYISKLTGNSIDQVVNWFIIALMLVFDPLAVSLIVGANVIFRDKEKEKEKLDKFKNIDLKISDLENKENDLINKITDYEKRENDIIENEKLLVDKFKKLENDILKFDDNSKREKEKFLEKRREIENSINSSNNLKEDIKIVQLELEESKKNFYNDKKSYEKEFNDLIKLKEVLQKKEKSIKLAKDDLVRLDDEIKNWENLNWKMRRMKTKPPSAE